MYVQGVERRTSYRVPVNRAIELQLEDWSSPRPARAINLSTTGLQVSDSALGDLGQRARCRLLFAPREPITVEGEVVWVSDESGARGMGLRFAHANPTAMLKLSQLVRRLDEIADGTAAARAYETGEYAADDLTLPPAVRVSALRSEPDPDDDLGWRELIDPHKTTSTAADPSPPGRRALIAALVVLALAAAALLVAAQG